jgi:hypothetical protein
MVARSRLLLLLIMGTITFLNEPKDSVNRQAHISTSPSGFFFIDNGNMPYLGTLHLIWTKAELLEKIKNKDVKVEGIKI